MRLLVLMLLMTSLQSFSQTSDTISLKPIVIHYQGTDYFGFTRAQSEKIYTLARKGSIADSLVISLDKLSNNLRDQVSLLEAALIESKLKTSIEHQRAENCMSGIDNIVKEANKKVNEAETKAKKTMWISGSVTGLVILLALL